MGTKKYSDLELKVILHEAAAQNPHTKLSPYLLGQITDIPRHIWKMRMKEEIDTINDNKFIKERDSLETNAKVYPVGLVNYFDEFSKLLEKGDRQGVLNLAKDVMTIHYRLLSKLANKEENPQLAELIEKNNKIESELINKEQEIKDLKQKYEKKLRDSEKKYYKLAACALGSFKEVGLDNVRQIKPFKENKEHAAQLFSTLTE